MFDRPAVTQHHLVDSGQIAAQQLRQVLGFFTLAKLHSCTMQLVEPIVLEMLQAGPDLRFPMAPASVFLTVRVLLMNPPELTVIRN